MKESDCTIKKCSNKLAATSFKHESSCTCIILNVLVCLHTIQNVKVLKGITLDPVLHLF